MKTHYALTRLSLLTAGLSCAGAAFASTATPRRVEGRHGNHLPAVRVLRRE